MTPDCCQRSGVDVQLHVVHGRNGNTKTATKSRVKMAIDENG